MVEDNRPANSGGDTDIAAENARSVNAEPIEAPPIISPNSVTIQAKPEMTKEVKMGPKGIELVFPRVDNVFTHKESINF